MNLAAPWVTVVIPTRDSAGWMALLLAHYQARGITPLLLLDSRTTDATAAIAAQAGVAVVPISGFTFTEAIVSATATHVQTPWALFMHDDEIPSDALFARLAGAPPAADAQSVAITRRWAWYQPGQQLQYGRSAHWADRTGQPGMDHHWRLFRPAAVTFAAKMHSEGFLIDRWARLPPAQYFVHFEWVLRSHAQRLAKLRRYDQQRYGYGRFFENLYLPEDQPPGVIDYLPFETDGFNVLAAAYYAARKPAPPLPRRTARDHLARGLNFCRTVTGLNRREPADRAGLTPRPEQEVTLP